MSRRRKIIKPIDNNIIQKGYLYYSFNKDKYNEIKEYPIYLFLQFFISNNSQRNEEMRFCLQKNVNNKHIDKIYLLNERIYSSQELGIESDKIIQINIKERLTFQKVFSFIREIKEDIYAVTCNSDIFLDETINNIKKGTLSIKPSCQALLRYEYKDENNIDIEKNNFYSQDTWILFNKYLRDKNLEITNIPFGVGGCDNAICERLNRLGFIIYNEPHMIKTYHYHREEKREWEHKQKIAPPYLYPKITI